MYFSPRHSRDRQESIQRVRFLWLRILVKRRYVALESGVFLGIVRCAPDTLYGDKECPESPFYSLMLAGPVVGAPGAYNLKIRPEFFPVGVPSKYIFNSSFPRQAGIHAASSFFVAENSG